MRGRGGVRFSLIRRLIAGYVAVAIGYFSVVLPARAFAPVAVIGAAQVVSAGGASYAFGALAGLIGLGGLYLELSDDQGNSSRIPLKNGPEGVPPAPAAAPTVPSESGLIYYVNGQSGASPGEACDKYIATGTNYGNFACYKSERVSGPNPEGCYSFGYVSNAPCTVPETQNYPCYWCSAHTVTSQSATVCPPGYSASGSSCVLTEPRKAAPDKKCDLQVSANKYLYYDDADCPNGPTIDHSKAVPGLRQNGERVYVYGTDARGRPTVYEMFRYPDGSAVEIRRYIQTGGNVDTTTVKVDPGTGTIQSVTSTVNPGQITSPTVSPTDPATVADPTNTPTVTTDTTKQPTLQFPDDYARENTAQRTATAVETIATELTKTTEGVDPEIPPSGAFGDAFFKGTFSDLLGWRLPGHTSQCPVGSFSWNSSTYAIDAHCQLVNNHFGALQSAMTVVWSLAALFIVLRA